MTKARRDRPRLGFVGLGWIGLNRMEAMARTGAAEIAGLCDPARGAVDAALAVAPGARRARDLDDLLAMDLDGVVIATPSARHAAEALQALEAGCAVFCQKPLGRSAEEARAVVTAARRRDLLLSVDLSYRRTAAVEAIRKTLDEGRLGRVFAADLTFHNAYGPDKPWFYDIAQSGGGCVMDLGVHLVDLALWLLDYPSVEGVEAHLYRQGQPVGPTEVEDLALVTLRLGGGVTVRISCSWSLDAGQDAVICADLWGTKSGAAIRNPGGGFYDLSAELLSGTARRDLAAPPDDWGGRMAADWVSALADGSGFDPSAAHLVALSETLDRIYDAGRPVADTPRRRAAR